MHDSTANSLPSRSIPLLVSDSSTPFDSPRGTLLQNRDPVRLFPERDRRRILARQGGLCAGSDCGQPLLEGATEFHHVIPHSLLGPTHADNGVALCLSCHRDAHAALLPQFYPRPWQANALEPIVNRLILGQFATLAAAPGAGKTQFSIQAAVSASRRAGIDHLVIFSPTAPLTVQWATACGKAGIPIDPKPRGGLEARGHTGISLTYQALSNPDTVAEIASAVEAHTSLVILDEAHHLAEDASGQQSRWAEAVRTIVGTIHSPRSAVLNLSGTLFRSRPDQKIPTIRYRPVPGRADRVEAVADFTVTSGELIDAGVLRHVDVYAFNAELQAVTPRNAQSLSVIDLNDHGPQVRSAALAALIRDEVKFIAPILDHALTLIAEKTNTLGEPVKGLVVCDDTEHADQVHAYLQTRLGRHALKAHSNTPDPATVLEQFRTDPSGAILVTVRMVTEGFDCPEAAVLVVANRITAPLYVNQVSARVMRVSEAERRNGTVLPATILIPADPAMIDAYGAILSTGARTVELAQNCDTCNTSPCACRPVPGQRQCAGCAMPWRLCLCLCPTCGGRALVCGCPRTTTAGNFVTVTVTSDAEVAQITHDGHSVDLDLWQNPAWESFGVPQVYRPAAIAAVTAMADTQPMIVAAALLGATTPAASGTSLPSNTAHDKDEE